MNGPVSAATPHPPDNIEIARDQKNSGNNRRIVA